MNEATFDELLESAHEALDHARAQRRRRLRWSARPGTEKRGEDGRVLAVRAFGVKLGYWPCLKAPFVEVAFGRRRYDLWYGLPSYKQYRSL